MDTNYITPPTRIKKPNLPTIMLAGSIEMGSAEHWQNKIISNFQHNVLFYNPRRDDWDSSWKQSIHDEKFNEQVTWELDMLESADLIFMYFDPSTKSPISLLELGLFAHSSKLIVYCPEGFWRKGNVDIVCSRYQIPVFKSYDRAVRYLEAQIEIIRNFNEVQN